MGKNTREVTWTDYGLPECRATEIEISIKHLGSQVKPGTKEFRFLFSLSTASALSKPGPSSDSIPCANDTLDLWALPGPALCHKHYVHLLPDSLLLSPAHLHQYVIFFCSNFSIVVTFLCNVDTSWDLNALNGFTDTALFSAAYRTWLLRGT